MKLNKLLQTIEISIDQPNSVNLDFDMDITGLALDSRQIKPGNLFFAYPGCTQDGRDYIDSALSKGASVILCDPKGFDASHLENPNASILFIENLALKVGRIASRFYGDPSKKLSVIGITGTNGKSSTMYLLASALNALSCKTAVIGTIGTGDVKNLMDSLRTTPDAVSVQKLMAEFYAKGYEAVVMEVSSHALMQGRVSGIEFDMAVFTNLTHDHLDYHKTLEAYAAAKWRLFDEYPITQAVLNLDDEVGLKWFLKLKERPELDVFGFTKKSSAVLPPSMANIASSDILCLQGVEMTQAGILGIVEFEKTLCYFNSSLLGTFNIENLLAVFSALLSLGYDLESVFSTIPYLKTVPGRMEMYGGEGNPVFVIDFAHTPDALEKALLSLRAHCKGQLWCVFGCGGDRDRGKRSQMAAISEKFADKVIVTSDNPRTESLDQINAEILAGFTSLDKVKIIPDRKDAIVSAYQEAACDDVILLAGKGHEKYQLIGHEYRAFDEVSIVNELLEKA